MATLSELYKELRKLPKGNLYRKTIHGRSYVYHQYFDAGKRFTTIVSPEDVEPLMAAIKRRKELEVLIDEKKAKDVSLSPAALSLTGNVMSANLPVAKFEKGMLVDMDLKRVPSIIARTRSLEEFLKLRVIDMTRTNARILKRMLGIQTEEDYQASLYSYALSVSDDYWFKPKHSKLKYKDVDFDNDALFDTAISGEVNVFYHKAKLSPELTTTGSFEKGWRLIDGTWWLYKRGSKLQFFSECFSSSFANTIGVPSVDYQLDGDFIRCPNFAPDVNFEPMAAFTGSDDSFETVFPMMSALGKDIALQYLKLICFDAMVNNVDRHSENFGILRDPASGDVISLAPNFDNNVSLLAINDYLNPDPKKDGFIQCFVRFLQKDMAAQFLFREARFPRLSEKDIQEILDKIPLKIEDEPTFIKTILARYHYLTHLF